MTKLSATLVCLVLVSVCYSQKASVKGNVLDSFNHQPFPNAVIALLQAKDSVLCKFTRSTENGHFLLTGIKPGKYVLLVTAPSFADFADSIQVSDSARFDYGAIGLLLKARLLEEVIVRQTVAAIKIKGDTTEYKADSFQVKPNATVEELLKQLPGIQVDRKGQITAYGETVQRVLVDGEEFFGDDPTLVTQNLRADMVDKVQVYDKKSDQAVFTGVDDGEKSKTINLKLKEDKKKGYFGKVNAGTGTEGYHDIQAMVNLFKNKQKLAAYGIKSNTGTKGLDWRDRDSYGQQQDLQYDEDGGYYFSVGDDNDGWDGRFNGRGFPQVKTGGVHYGNKWNEDKRTVNGNYKIQDMQITGSSEGENKYLLPDSAYYSIYARRFYNNALRQKLDGSYEMQLDSSSSLKLTATGVQEHKESIDNDYTTSLAGDSSLVNKGETKTSSVSNSKTLNSSLLWRKKLARKGRTFSFAFNEKYKSRTSDGLLDARTSFYTAGNLDSLRLIDQVKKNSSETISMDANMVYTEPLSASSSLGINYGVVINNNLSQRSSYNKENEKYEKFDSTVSSNYRFNVFTHKGGINYTFSKKKLRITAGSNIGITSFHQDDLMRNSSRSRNFINWFPRASASLTPSSGKRINIKYEGNTRQPSIEDIQPLRTNDNPLYVLVGNPDLKPSFDNTFRFGYDSYKVLTQQSIWINGYFSFTQNAISRKTSTDNTGKTTSQAVNLNGNWYSFVYGSYGFKLKKTELSFRPGAELNMSRNMSYVNGLLNETRNNTYTMNLSVYRYKDKSKYSFNVYGSAAYTSGRSSVQQQVKTNYWTYKIRPDMTLYLPFHMELYTEFDVNLREKLNPTDQNNNVVIWNAWVSKKFFKNESLQLKVSANDLLNQNTGFSRYISSNSISQSTYTTIRRYGLVSLVWNFNKMGGNSK